MLANDVCDCDAGIKFVSILASGCNCKVSVDQAVLLINTHCVMKDQHSCC